MVFFTRFNLLLFLLVQAGITITEGRRRSRRGFVLSREDLEHYTSDTPIEDYDFTTPVYIEPESMVSKRSVGSKPVTSTEREVKFNAFGQTYHARLQPNYWLLRPGLVVERVGADGTITEEDIPSRDCYYYTHLLSHSGESAGALSTCDGLRGMISHDESDIYISPLKDHHASRYRRETQDEYNGDRPHLVYKRSSRRGQQTSETTPSASSSFDYDQYDENTNDADSDRDEEIYYSYDKTSQFDGNNTFKSQTFCVEVYDNVTAPGYTDDLDPSPQHSHSWNQGSLDGGNVSHSEPIFADMAAGQEEGDHLQEGGHRYIEIFLIVDDAMYDYHGEDALNYSLALMNIVSRRYIDRTLLAEVRIALVKIVLSKVNKLKMTGLDGKNYTLNLQGNGQLLLHELCAWQRRFNPTSDDDPLHYDTATLITRRDLFHIVRGREDTGLLGMALLGMMCVRKNSCDVNEDTGLETGLTITHELGHSLNLEHDPSYGCENGKNIMATTSTSGPNSFRWSSCSSQFFLQFLESPRSRCLLDEPSTDHAGVQMLPIDELAGARYNRLAQCRITFGSQVTRVCDLGGRFHTCGHMGCMVRYPVCSITGVMEGTYCGRNKWCIEGFCVSSIGGLPKPIDGGWGPWGRSFSGCSRSCGTGVIHRKRPCNNPAPRFGGKACEGPMYIMKTCNPNPCPGVTISDQFRHRQCALSNSVLFDGGYLKWKANMDGYIRGNRLCELGCVSGGYAAVRPPRKVEAGTRCWDNLEHDELRRTRRCIDQQCKEFGCDGVYGSGKLLDGCGKCEGSGRTCSLVTGILRNPISKTMKYQKWFIIPVGATMVNITNTNAKRQTMALVIGGRDVWRAHARSYDRVSPTRFIAGDIHILFHGVMREIERVWILSGPTTKEIQIDIKQESRQSPMVSLTSFRNNPTLFYEYYEPISDPVSYYWEVYPISECSVMCGGGNQTINATCIEEINGEKVNISDRFCEETTVKPVTIECNTQYCAGPYWLKGDWGECSVTCGDGTKERPLSCIDGSTMESLAEAQCVTGATFVSSTTPCRFPACPTPCSNPPCTTPCSNPPCTTQGPSILTPENTGTLTMTDGDVSIEVTTSTPLIAILPTNGCTKEYNTTNLLVSLTVSVLALLFKLNM